MLYGRILGAPRAGGCADMIEHAVTIIDQTMNNCEKEKVSYTQYESSRRNLNGY